MVTSVVTPEGGEHADSPGQAGEATSVAEFRTFDALIFHFILISFSFSSPLELPVGD